MNIKASINEKIQSISNTSLIRIMNDINISKHNIWAYKYNTIWCKRRFVTKYKSVESTDGRYIQHRDSSSSLWS